MSGKIGGDAAQEYLDAERSREASSLWRQVFCLILQQTGNATEAQSVANGAVAEFRNQFGGF